MEITLSIWTLGLLGLGVFTVGAIVGAVVAIAIVEWSTWY